MIFKIRLVGKVIEIHSLHDRVQRFCKDYLTEDDKTDVLVATTQADIDAERETARQERIAEGLKPINHSDATLEITAIYRKICAKLIDYDAFLMHGAVVAVDGEAYLFTALSGTGKSTHTGLWLKNIPGSFIVNGDKPLLQVSDRTYVCGTPWAGKERLQTNTVVPLKAIILLERGAKNEIEKISFQEAMPTLLTQTHRSADREHLLKSLSLLYKTAETVRFYRLKCNMEDEAALVAYNCMK